jgi:serine/threonine protein kinase
MSNYWPSMTDYQEALQSPPLAFGSSELGKCSVVENNLGLPRPFCGTFASVYELVNGRRRWAAKCFLRNTPDLHERYAKISDHVRKCRRLGYFVEFEYLQQAIRVRGELFPLVKMEWIEAYQLNTFVEENLFRPHVLKKLAKNWDRLITDLRSADIAHGDLQHGNVLVESNGAIRLIDYDGMCVPALEGQGSNETGHPDYQNPRRTQRDFHLKIDGFSGAVIYIAIAALRHDNSLWEKYNNGDNLLFRRGDFLDTENSDLIADLRAMNDAEISDKLDYVVSVCPKRKGTSAAQAKPATETSTEAHANPEVASGTRAANKKRIPPSKRKRPSKRRKQSKGTRPAAKAAATTAAKSAAPAWLSDHVEDFGTSARQSSGGLFAWLGRLLGGGGQQTKAPGSTS